ncbi:uncharacterized protein LOC142585729 isoform X2 [Dermacentor variabilis]|uniref:uncharacterized protein LOC142585729 isoform X2 n=1 Tax=Dermacentor variabilis TaxID=34621 RepID=UPI003F5C3510
MHSFATTLCMASAVATEAAVMRNAYSLASRSIFQLRSLVGFPSNGIERDEEGGTKAKQTRSFQRVPSRSTASLALDFGTQVELAEEKKGRRDFDSSRSTLLCRTPRPCTARSSQGTHTVDPERRYISGVVKGGHTEKFWRRSRGPVKRMSPRLGLEPATSSSTAERK